MGRRLCWGLIRFFWFCVSINVRADYFEVGLAMANRKRKGAKGHINSMMNMLQSAGRQASICEIGTIEERCETPDDAFNSSAGWGNSSGWGLSISSNGDGGGSAVAEQGAVDGDGKKRKKTASLGSLQGNSLVQRRQKKKLSSGSSASDADAAMMTPLTADPTLLPASGNSND